MGCTLNLKDKEARALSHLVENELGRLADGSVPDDEEYEGTLQDLLTKIDGPTGAAEVEEG